MFRLVLELVHLQGMICSNVFHLCKRTGRTSSLQLGQLELYCLLVIPVGTS